jgi:uncharacterized protein
VGPRADVVQQAYAAFGRGDIPALLEMMDDDIDWMAPATLPHGGRFRGKDGVGKFLEGVGAAWDPLVLEVETLGAVGDDLAVGIVRADGTRRGGGPSGYGAVHLFTVRDGRITRFREYTDLDAPL